MCMMVTKKMKKEKKIENNFHHRLLVILNLKQFQSCITLIEKKIKKNIFPRIKNINFHRRILIIYEQNDYIYEIFDNFEYL